MSDSVLIRYIFICISTQYIYGVYIYIVMLYTLWTLCVCLLRVFWFHHIQQFFSSSSSSSRSLFKSPFISHAHHRRHATHSLSFSEERMKRETRKKESECVRFHYGCKYTRRCIQNLYNSGHVLLIGPPNPKKHSVPGGGEKQNKTKWNGGESETAKFAQYTFLIVFIEPCFSFFFLQIIPMMHMLHFDRVQVTVVVVSIVEECHRRLTRRLPFQAVAPQLGVVV